jgi:hypothetical protein
VVEEEKKCEHRIYKRINKENIYEGSLYKYCPECGEQLS